MLTRIAHRLYRTNSPSLATKLANLAARDQSFSLDQDGHWLNKLPDATFASPTMNTRKFEQIKREVMFFNTYAYSPKSGDIIIDVGAGIGEEAIVFSKIVGPQGRILAIEAHPSTFLCLQKTVSLSGLTNVTPIQCAVAASDGEARMRDKAHHLGNQMLSEGGIAVPQRSIDSLVKEQSIDRVDLLRCNIEGAERFLVQGITESLPKVRNVCISCHDFRGNEPNGDFFRTKAEISDWIVASGFKLITRPDEPTRPWVSDYVYGTKD